MLKNKKIGFIGGGNMATALVSGILSSEKVSADHIYISDKSEERLESMSTMGVYTTTDNLFIEQNCDIIIFCIKPNVFDLVMADIKGSSDKLYISIAAGISLDYLIQKLGFDKKIVRTMPNMPAQVGCGMTVLCPNSNMSKVDMELVHEVFASVGEYIELDEKHINIAMALQGSSPAYAFMMIDAMADAGVKHGLPRSISCHLAAKALEGSAKTVLKTQKHPASLKNDVCSPSGTTIEAVHMLEDCGFTSAIHKAIDACVNKGNQMNK